MKDFYAKLITGGREGDANRGELKTTYDHLEAQLSRFCDEISGPNADDEDWLKLYGPFLGRSILDLSTIALLGRLDPFRLLGLRKIQTQATYRVGERVVSAIQWTGDIFAREAPNNLWSPDKDFQKISRSLLADPFEEIFWRPAFSKLCLDTVAPRGGDWIIEIRGWNEEEFLPRKKRRMAELYSGLSKGIHHEFLFPPDLIYTADQIREYITEVIQHCAIFGLLFAFMEHIAFRVPVDESLDAIEGLQAAL